MSNGIIRLAESQLPSSCLSITRRQRSSITRSCPMVIIPADCRLFLYLYQLSFRYSTIWWTLPVSSAFLGLTPVIPLSLRQYLHSTMRYSFFNPRFLFYLQEAHLNYFQFAISISCYEQNNRKSSTIKWCC